MGIFCRLISDQLIPDLDLPVDFEIRTADTAEIWAGLGIIYVYRNPLSHLKTKIFQDAAILLPSQSLKRVAGFAKKCI